MFTDGHQWRIGRGILEVEDEDTGSIARFTYSQVSSIPAEAKASGSLYALATCPGL